MLNNPFNIHRAKTEVLNESFKYHIPEDIPANERTAFHGAAADAAKKGKKSFNFGGKTHPVTMKKDLANKIADQKESVNESFAFRNNHSYHNDMAKAHRSHAMRHNSEYHHGNHNDDDEDMHSRAIDIHKRAHAAHIQARNLSSYDSKGEYKKAAKDAHEYSKTAIGTTKDAGKFKTGQPKHKFPKKLKSPTMESTISFREKLVSLYEGDRAAHYKGATAPEGMHDKFKSSKGDMDMVNVQKSVEADGMKAAKDTADNIKKSAPGKKMRSTDKNVGDLAIKPSATPVKDPSAKMQTAESYGASGNAIPNSLLDAVNKVNENQKKIEKTEKISNFLKSVYGDEIYNDKVDKLSKTEFTDLCENLQNGVAISTPVFDGAKEKNVTEMLQLAKLPGSGPVSYSHLTLPTKRIV